MRKILGRAGLFLLLLAALSIAPAPAPAYVSECDATIDQILDACNEAYSQEEQVNQCIRNLVRHYCE